uniref:sn-1-specific diacylglycerol lipase n=1 Tax=Mucochytrium quahogii TaxID=96639 RepID=A0A7S2S6E4_9STRA|mmetsp:Transcript_13208/g.21452  ORF Transcript_13208/g.21452 Transcript_13208/m.21452 type:complete len:553 (+) Transcript_13208:149-1807(+)
MPHAARGLLQTLTKWRVGIALCGVAGGVTIGMCYSDGFRLKSHSGWNEMFQWAPRMTAFLTGASTSVCMFGGFYWFRRLVRPIAYKGSAPGGVVEPNSLIKQLSRSMLSPEWHDAVVMLSSLLDQVEVMKFKRTAFEQSHSNLTNLALLASVQGYMKHLEYSKLQLVSVPKDGMENARYFIKFANAAYGYYFCAALGLINKERVVEIATTTKSVLESDMECFKTLSGQSDLEFAHISQYYEKIYSPKHYIIVDHSHKRIIFTIRGTSSISDVMTDLACQVENFPCPQDVGEHLHFKAHSGMLQGAKNVLKESGSMLKSLLEKYPKHELFITGHSLGAGSALLVTLLLRIGYMSVVPDGGRVVHCVAFGAPPVISLDKEYHSDPLLNDMFDNGTIQNYVNQSDIVPRLSLWSANRLFVKLDRLDALSRNGVLNRYKRWVATIKLSRSYDDDWADAEVREQIIRALQVDEEEEEFDSQCEHQNHFKRSCVRLFHPGVIYEITKTSELIRRDDYHEIKDILVDTSANFLFDHLPSQYQDRLVASSREVVSAQSQD